MVLDLQNRFSSYFGSLGARKSQAMQGVRTEPNISKLLLSILARHPILPLSLGAVDSV